MPPAKTDPVVTLLTGEVVDRVKHLELFSRLWVEGSQLGDNPLPLRGTSIDFLQHRQYFPGDSLRYLDWRVLAKTNRLYIKQYEDVTNAEITVVLDTSASMGYQGVGMSKLEFAVRCAGILFYIAHLQRDNFSLYLFANDVVERIPRGTSRRHLARVFERLVTVAPAGETRFEKCLNAIEVQSRRKGIFIVLSDFMDDPEQITKAYGRFRGRKHDTLAFQIFDPSERELEFVDFTRFRDMEDGSILALDPLLVRDEYRRQFQLHQERLKEGCLNQAIGYCALPIQPDFDTIIGEYLRRRGSLIT
jgi:uncharacterized protein (DUF58 family)